MMPFLLSAAAVFATAMAFLSTISLYIGLSALAGPTIGIIAHTLFPVGELEQPSVMSVIEVQHGLLSFASNSINMTHSASKKVDQLVRAIDDVVLAVQKGPQGEGTDEALRALLDVKRTSQKMLLGVAEFAMSLYRSAESFHDAVNYSESNGTSGSVEEILCSLPFAPCRLPRLRPSYYLHLSQLSEDCVNSVNLLGMLHDEILVIVDDLWPRIDRDVLLNGNLTAEDHTRVALSEFAHAASSFFKFATTAKYKSGIFFQFLSLVHDRVEELLAVGLDDQDA